MGGCDVCNVCMISCSGRVRGEKGKWWKCCAGAAVKFERVGGTFRKPAAMGCKCLHRGRTQNKKKKKDTTASQSALKHARSTK